MWRMRWYAYRNNIMLIYLLIRLVVYGIKWSFNLSKANSIRGPSVITKLDPLVQSYSFLFVPSLMTSLISQLGPWFRVSELVGIILLALILLCCCTQLRLLIDIATLWLSASSVCPNTPHRPSIFSDTSGKRRIEVVELLISLPLNERLHPRALRFRVGQLPVEIRMCVTADTVLGRPVCLPFVGIVESSRH